MSERIPHPPDVSKYDDLLKGVSRSFYLSMRILPAPMRGPISLAYLLARASDTIADSEGIEATTRLEALQILEAQVSGAKGRLAARLLVLLREQIIPEIVDEKEKLLLSSLESILGRFYALDQCFQQPIRKVVQTIIAGQCFDVERFEIQKGRIENKAELLKYCYQVAGCVGEFWTEIGKLTQSRFSRLEREILMERGRQYGVALQLINILRDAPKDYHLGRCYLPNMKNLDKLTIDPWITFAREGLEAGLEYADSLSSRRCRLATYLPAAIGLDTLDKLEASSEKEWHLGVKVKRSQVYRSLFEGFLR